jgi:hypothetical protein
VLEAKAWSTGGFPQMKISFRLWRPWQRSTS